MELPDMRSALLELGCGQVYHGVMPIPPTAAMIAKAKTPPRSQQPKLPLTPASQPPAPLTPTLRWVRTQRYGWDKGGNRGGRR
jgi:hypothetical protein